MEKNYEMNPEQFFYILKKHIAWIILIGILTAAAVGVLNTFLVTPKYSSSAKLYVNNNSDKSSYTQSDLAVAKSLVSTYIVIIESDTTLEKVADSAGVDYTPKQLRKAIKATSISGTEAFSVTVTDSDRNVAYNIATAVVEIAPEEISRVVEGGKVKIIDEPKVATDANDTGRVRNSVIGFFVGFAVSLVIFFLVEILDVTIYSEDDLTGRFSYPVIGVIPGMTYSEGAERGKKSFGKVKGGDM